MRKFLLISTLVVLAVFATACGGDDNTNNEGGMELEIGAQTYTDPKILAQMVKAVVEEETDHTVNITEDIQASPQIIQALDQGEFDIATLYSGEVYNNHFDEDKVEFTTDPDETIAQAQELFGEKFGIKWYDTLGFQNKYGIAVKDSFAEENGIETISDLEEHADELVIGTDTSWVERENDGYRAFQEAYGYEFKDVKGMEVSLMYEGVENGELDVITAYTVDPQILELDMRILEDDGDFFPPYSASLVSREDLVSENEEINEVLESFVGTIDEETMTGLIYEVDIEGKSPEEVAIGYLEENGFLE
ncbi:glycine/betaine ABC transporter substrate-binding protein [Halalkalibacillus sediminis]|uniref:Glycine/betaine ABC transporter substrate-binding protein n=1 Tax=Halalkalibacillus sediminis TaxID=2018042 RepID=A0A2I0QTH8_9BACI|nr:glycine betaine ABC transporter substrate-binding protein [Halalkalibacillus sediminis]PKR77647.1 glycine/betaine ABC transporter substrate-binding protein [Halalkalibacillus sediminis]